MGQNKDDFSLCITQCSSQRNEQRPVDQIFTKLDLTRSNREIYHVRSYRCFACLLPPCPQLPYKYVTLNPCTTQHPSPKHPSSFDIYTMSTAASSARASSINPTTTPSNSSHRSSTSTSTSASTINRNRQYTHLHAQLAQLNAHVADMENLVGMTAVQAEYMKGLGGWWGGA